MPDQRRIIDEEWEAKADGHGVAHIMSKVGSIAQFKGGFPHGVDLPRARIAALAPRMAKWVIEAQESGSTIEVEAHRLHGELIAADIREALQLEETPDTQDDHEEGQ